MLIKQTKNNHKAFISLLLEHVLRQLSIRLTYILKKTIFLVSKIVNRRVDVLRGGNNGEGSGG